MKIAFITSVFGDRENYPVKFTRVRSCDYFLFSDREQEDFKTSWDVFNISDNPNIVNLDCNVRKSRYAKFLGYELLDSMGVEYDCIYYCDVHFSPKRIDWVNISNKFISKDFPFGQDQHHFRYIRQGGILAECRSILKCHKEKKENIDKTINFYMESYPDINLSAKQYYVNTMFGYYPNETVKKVTRDFWDIYTNSDITFRDQPTWNLILLKHGVRPVSKLGALRQKFNQTGIYGNHRYA